ncbi:MAG: iron-containing alcohol dehydrogenase [Deltaproteobacteria bacterium]|nr:iron-containing alcohol dehydrogenase [Deltaproteobacteria bacterium]
MLLVTDKGVRQAGVTRSVEEVLAENGKHFVVFDDIEVDPSVECVNRGVDIIGSEKLDAIVVIGGGSPICAAKGISVVATNGGSIRDYEGPFKAKVIPLPVIALPTTAGSGSEVSPVFLIKDYERDRKMSCKGDYHPVVAILDPLLLTTLPYWQAVCSYLDAMTHAVDAFSSNQATPITDAMAFASVKIMGKHLFRAAATESIESREQMLIASSMANLACANAGLALVHAVTYGLQDLPHGYACGLVMPFALEYNLPVSIDKMADLGRAIGVNEEGKTTKELAYEAVKSVKKLYRELGFPNKLTEAEVPSSTIPEMVELTLKSHMMALNIRKPTKKNITELFENIYMGWDI